MSFTVEQPPDAAAFRDDMAALFSALDPELLRTNTPDVIATMMDSIRRHQVRHLLLPLLPLVPAAAAAALASQGRFREWTGAVTPGALL